MRRFKNVLIYTLIFILLLPIFMDTYIVHASDIGEKKVFVEKIDGKQFAKIAVTGNTGSSGLRYRTKGWWVQASFGGKDFPSSGQKFYTDSDLEGKNGDMVVYIPISLKGKGKTPIYEFLGVPKEYYRQGGKVKFDAGQIIVHNGQETNPTYDSFNGINNGIRERFGVSWPSSAQRDLRTYYNHRLDLDPEIDLDWVEATHKTVDGKILSIDSEEPEEAGPHTVYSKKFDGYECIDPVEGEHTVEIKKRKAPEKPKKHEVEFIYSTGELKAVIDGPTYVEEGERFDLSGEDSNGTFFDIPLDTSKGQKMYWYRDGKSVATDKEVLERERISKGDIHPSRDYVLYTLVVVDSIGKTASAEHKVRIGVKPPEPPPKGEVVADLSLRATAGGWDLPYVVPYKESNLYYADEFRDSPLYAPQDGTAYFSRKDWDNFMSLNNSANRTTFKSTYMEEPREESNYEPSFLNNIEYDYSRSTSTYELDEYKTKFYTYNSNSFDEDDPRENEARSAYNDHYQMKGYVDYVIRKYYFNLNSSHSGEYTFKGKVKLTDITGVSDEAEAIGKAPIRILRGIPFAVAEVTPNVCFVGEGVYVANKSFDRHNYIEKNYISIYNMDDGVEVYNFSDIEGTRLHNTDYIEKVNSASVEGVSVTFNKPGRYRATVSVWNDDTAADHDNVEFIVNPEPRPPVADFEIPPYVFAGEDIPIRCTSTDPDDDIVMRIWDYPDNEKPEYAGFLDPTSPGLSNEGGILRFLVTGTFTVKLTVVDSTGLEDSVEKEVQVMPPIPVARITQEGTLKENRKVILHLRDSISPKIDPIQMDKTEWTITPLEGQKPSSIKVDTESSTKEERQVLFKETGKYEVGLSLHNKYTSNPLNWGDENTAFRHTKITIDIKEDFKPNANIDLDSIEAPSFRKHGTSIKIPIEAVINSPDEDIIAYSFWKLWRDDNEDANFNDEELINTFKNETVFELDVKFKEGIKGLYQVELFAKENFGQPTIPKFIIDEDYKTRTVIEKFNINWIPDIDYTLDEWAYTDDVLKIDDVVIKDEVVDTTKVKWSLKRAKPINPSVMEEVDIEKYTQNILGKWGGQIKFKESGYYQLIATVTDEIGQSFSYPQNIRIYPFPTAVISDLPQYRFHKQFEAKQNRRYHLHGNNSYIHDYYGNGIHEIDRTKDYWEIIALDGQNINEAVKIRNGTSSGLKNAISDNTKFVVENKKLEDDLLFKIPGRYKVRYQVTNEKGKKSSFTEEIITVKEDLLPIGNFEVINPTYREKDTGKPATLTAYSISTSSPDEDNIALRQARYRFDSNNNGSYDDEIWSAALPIVDNKAEIKVPKVGKYQIELLVRESYGQATLDEFITVGDVREYKVYKEIEVDNIRPTVDFKVTPTNKVDIAITLGRIAGAKTQELERKINEYVKTTLDSSNADVINTFIQMLETSTVDSKTEFPWVVYNLYNNGLAEGEEHKDGQFKSEEDSFYYKGYGSEAPIDHLYYDDGIMADREFTFDIDMTGYNACATVIPGFIFGADDTSSRFKGYAALMWHDVIVVYYFDAMDHAYLTRNGAGQIANAYTRDNVGYNNTFGNVEIARVNTATTSLKKNIKMVYTDNKLQIYDGGSLLTTIIIDNPAGSGYGIAAVNSSHGCGTRSYMRFGNFLLKTAGIKTLDEVLTEPNWRENSTRFVVNLSDINLPELDVNSTKYPVVLSRMMSDNLYFAQLGTTANRTQALNFISHNSGKGTHIRNDNPNMDKALQDLAQYILDVIRSQAQSDVKYVLLNEEVSYNVIYNDYENDPNMNLDNWRYNHDHLYFENTLGRVNYNDIWLTGSINSFNRVGKFLIEHRTKDNPVGTDNRFDNYRKWSEMLNGPTTLYVHRKPIALFTANINRLSSAFRVTFKDDSYDLDHQSKSNKGLMTWEWSWKVDTATTWNTQTFSTKNAGISWINSQFNSKPLTNNYIVRLRVRDIDGENGIGEWSDPQVMLISNIGMPPIARFTVNPSVVPVNQNISIQDKSYDPNGDPIVEWRWVLSKTSGANQGTWNYSYNNSTNPYTDTKISDAVNNVIKSLGATNALGDYKLTLQVRDNTGPWGHSVSTSEIYTQTFRVIPVNKSPEAGFNLQSNQNPAWTFPQTVGNMTMLTRPNNKTFFIEELLKWNEWARDPDGHAMEYQWSLERYQVQNISSMHLDKNPEVKNYSGNLAASSPVKRYDNFKPFNGSFKSQGLGYGAYKITLRVNDLPPIPPFMSTDKETIFVTDTYYIIPDINFIENPSFEHEGEEIVVGDTIKLRTVTSKEVTSVNVELVGNNIPLTPISSNHNSITWEKEYIIPETLPERDSYELVFEAHTNYGGNGVNTRTISYSVPIDILTLKLINFRITHIVNHKPWWQKEYPSLNLHRDIKANPIYIDEMAVPYKGGYYATFMIDSKGKPDTVTSKVTTSNNDKPITIKMERYDNNPDIWIGRYTSSARIPIGTIINMELEATKNTTKYNYNTKEPFHGRTLKVEGSALQDGRVNRTN